jgi:hypothetical protein
LRGARRREGGRHFHYVSFVHIGPSAIGGIRVGVPFCRVEGIARPSSDSEIRFEVWLPSSADKWTGRMKVDGTGGYAGGVPYALLAQDIGDGFVAAGSNMGHDGGESPAWTVNRPEKVKDWGLRAHYSVATAAKALSAAYYDKPVRYSYFEGCSNGGRQAMMMAQNYPELFDGIAPARRRCSIPTCCSGCCGRQAAGSGIGKPPVLSDAKRALITRRILDKCDALDGLVDGQITNPRACNFDIDSLGSVRRQLADHGRARGGERDVWRNANRVWHAAVPGREARIGDRLDSALRRQWRIRRVHRALRVLAAHAGVRLAARAQLLERLRRSKGEAHTPFTAAPSPDISAVRRPRRQAAPLSRLERSPS